MNSFSSKKDSLETSRLLVIRGMKFLTFLQTLTLFRMRISWKLFGDRYLIFLLYSQPAGPMSRDCMIPSLPGAFRASFRREIFLRQYNLATRALIQSFSRTGHRLIQGLQCSQILLCFNTAH